MQYDERVIKYVEENSSELFGFKVLKGKRTSDYKIGFAGFASIMEVDISRTWKIEYDHIDIPYIKYCRVNIDEYGELTIIKEDD